MSNPRDEGAREPTPCTCPASWRLRSRRRSAFGTEVINRLALRTTSTEGWPYHRPDRREGDVWAPPYRSQALPSAAERGWVARTRSRHAVLATGLATGTPGPPRTLRASRRARLVISKC